MRSPPDRAGWQDKLRHRFYVTQGPRVSRRRPVFGLGARTSVQVVVRLEGEAGLREAFFEIVIPEVNNFRFLNTEATNLLRQPDTELIGSRIFDPKRATILGYASPCPNGGRLCPSLKLARGHDLAEVQERIAENLSTDFVLCSARKDLFLVQLVSQETADREYAVWLDELDDEEWDSLHPSRFKAPNLDDKAILAKAT